MPDLICKHCCAAVAIPAGYQLVAVAPPSPEPTSEELSFEQQQEALFRILSSYQESD